MERKKFNDLNEPRWVKLFASQDLEIFLAPGKWPREDDVSWERIAVNEAFLDFKNWTEGGEPIPNTLEERLAMLRMSNIRESIRMNIMLINGRAILGEDVAAKESSDTQSPS